jgi:RNA polymerase primary sigma factor
MRQAQYRHPALRQLNQQVRYVPVEKRLEQLNRAERLLAEVVHSKNYPYQYVCYRITGFRPTSYPGLLVSGADLDHDLTLFIQELGRTVPPVPAEEVPEPVLTLEQVSKNLRVSTKTISRWRSRGLVSRRIICDGQRKVGIRQSLLKRFLEKHQARVEKSSKFSQLGEEEKAEILRRAKRMARVRPDRFMDICRRIARKMGRSIEAVRYTIKKHDQANRAQAIFPGLSGPLDDTAKQALYSSYRRGIAVDALAKHFHRTRSSVHRVINEMRARRLLEQALDCIAHESFDQSALEAEILGPMPDETAYELHRRKARNSAPKGLPPELSTLYEVPLLSREQEAHLFRKMNFLKYQARKLREKIDPAQARSSDLERLEALQRQASAIKDHLISCNMRLVVSIAKRHAGLGDNFFELLSDGNVSLMRAVEKFDFSRGNKFSTYASWAIMKNFARSIPDEKHRRDRFLTGQELTFDTAADTRSDEQAELASAERAQQQVNRLLNRLDERERLIIKLRAGLDAERGLTLEQVGKELGITKERVRQLEARTMNKLRSIAREEKVEMP